MELKLSHLCGCEGTFVQLFFQRSALEVRPEEQAGNCKSLESLKNKNVVFGGFHFPFIFELHSREISGSAGLDKNHWIR